MTKEDLKYILLDYLKQAEMAEVASIWITKEQFVSLGSGINEFGTRHPRYPSRQCLYLQPDLLVFAGMSLIGYSRVKQSEKLGPYSSLFMELRVEKT